MSDSVQRLPDESLISGRFPLRVRRMLNHVAKGKRLLDLACGPGYSGLSYVNRHCGSAVCVDLSDKFLLWGDQCARRNGLDVSFVKSDLFRYSSEDKFEYVVMYEILEHYLDTDKMLSIAKSHLKPGGSLFLSTPTMHGPFGETDDNPEHVKIFTEEMLRDSLEKNDLSIEWIEDEQGVWNLETKIKGGSDVST